MASDLDRGSAVGRESGTGKVLVGDKGLALGRELASDRE